MKTAALLLACAFFLFATGCEDRTDTTAPVAPETEVREEGPAERTGRVLDEAGRRTAEAVGEGLEKAGEEIQERLPDSEGPATAPADAAATEPTRDGTD